MNLLKLLGIKQPEINLVLPPMRLYPTQLKVKRLDRNAILPTRAKSDDAGLDLYALEDITIPASAVISPITNKVLIGQAHIRTGIAVEIPPGYYGKVDSRSGLSFKWGIETGAGVIDAGYRGEIQVKLYNHNCSEYRIEKGERVAQLIIQRCELWEPIEVDELSESERGQGGIGHTGR